MATDDGDASTPQERFRDLQREATFPMANVADLATVLEEHADHTAGIAAATDLPPACSLGFPRRRVPNLNPR